MELSLLQFCIFRIFFPCAQVYIIVLLVFTIDSNLTSYLCLPSLVEDIGIRFELIVLIVELFLIDLLLPNFLNYLIGF